jgi:RNA polymerase primary sigma factor
MTVMDKLTPLLDGASQVSSECSHPVLDRDEILMIADGPVECLTDFAASPRLHAVDSKGNTPLHLAAYSGSLARCTPFILAGAEIGALNHELRTPADVAFAEGHRFVARVLLSLDAKLPTAVATTAIDFVPTIEPAISRTMMQPKPPDQEGFSHERDASSDEPYDLISFQPEHTPENSVGQSEGGVVAGIFVPLPSRFHVNSTTDEREWDLDLSPASIVGEGIGTGVIIIPDQEGGGADFLKVRNRGRKSVRRVVFQSSTWLSIASEVCMAWAEEILAKGWFSVNDMDGLVALCEGNGDPKQLRVNLQRNLEAAGFDQVEQAPDDDLASWDAKSKTSACELAEAIEAILTRSIRLPGTRRFVLDKSDETRLLEPMVRAKQELQLAILACEAAVDEILDILDRIRDGTRDASSVSLRVIIPARRDHGETAEVFAAAETLKAWQVNGRVMDGKRRREALLALEALDLSLIFHKELADLLERKHKRFDDANRLDALISIFDDATKNLILKHLSYARRFAARNVEEGEDPEEVFQVAFIGLQNSTRRFDPERGFRFLVYATYWMRQAIMRWRADEGKAIRVPVHRHEYLAKLDRAMLRLDVRADGAVSDKALAEELEWAVEQVRQFRGIPREAEYPEYIEEWDDLLPDRENADAFDQRETRRIVRDALAELPQRQADVIRMRFGIERDGEMTLEEIGQLYGVTRERIRQIEAKGLDSLSHPGRKRRLQELLGR